MKWVPNSEVLVAQNRDTLCVWYSSECPEKKTSYPIKGAVLEVRREPSAGGRPGKTTVVSLDGNKEVEFDLDNSLIEFGFALQNRELETCVGILESQKNDEEQEGNWQTLANLAIEELNLPVAERAFVALGNYPRACYLRKINKMILQLNQ